MFYFFVEKKLKTESKEAKKIYRIQKPLKKKVEPNNSKLMTQKSFTKKNSLINSKKKAASTISSVKKIQENSLKPILKNSKNTQRNNTFKQNSTNTTRIPNLKYIKSKSEENLSSMNHFESELFKISKQNKLYNNMIKSLGSRSLSAKELPTDNFDDLNDAYFFRVLNDLFFRKKNLNEENKAVFMNNIFDLKNCTNKNIINKNFENNFETKLEIMRNEIDHLKKKLDGSRILPEASSAHEIRNCDESLMEKTNEKLLNNTTQNEELLKMNFYYNAYTNKLQQDLLESNEKCKKLESMLVTQNLEFKNIFKYLIFYFKFF